MTYRRFPLGWLMLIATISLSTPSSGQPPGLINYQGRLVNGTNLVNGTINLELSLYNAPSGGTLLYTDASFEGVVDGLYNTFLGDQTAFGNLTTALNNTQVWLQVVVDGVPLTPRERIVSVPYARMVHGMTVGTNRNVTINPGFNPLNPLSLLNLAMGYGAVVGGGHENQASGNESTISGGYANFARMAYTTVGGGWGNLAEGSAATIGGGDSNYATNQHTTIAGGGGNVAGRAYATVGGGNLNVARGDRSTIAGGGGNIAQGDFSTIGGGGSSTASGQSSTVGGGAINVATGEYSTVGGGALNQAIGDASVVGGGWRNAARGNRSTVGGGEANSATGLYATVGGGRTNVAAGPYGTIGGGLGNRALGTNAVVAGGMSNVAYALNASVGGGFRNIASNEWSAIGGGSDNRANGDVATVAGGAFNRAGATWASVVGGAQNNANGLGAFVGGGYANLAGASYASVPGGFQNTASGDNASVPGGYQNTASGSASLAAGNRAKAIHNGTFVWADSISSDYTSTGTNQFLIRAGGGVGINTANPLANLHIAGDDPSGPFSGQLFIAGTLTSGASNSGAGLRLSGNDGNGPREWGFIRALKSNSTVGNTQSYMSFGTRLNGGSLVERMRLDTSGLTVNGTFVSASDREKKQDINLADSRDILDRVVAMPVHFWRYKDSPEVLHIGPMAQDFFAAFGVGPDDRHIASVDADGVALAAIQGLAKRNDELKKENEVLRAEIDAIKRKLGM
ncbi:MAG TPA: hypothetical protein PKE26_10230 [Kiritimatiellia bacterium]|nr:hypothetical protein [Kiritimatiellia bacterium]HMO99475.1 hypothetical protein [Kiritimatiellia bacterium]HMP97072.1 hypothetical protein [Kiritimatiellia bacterium]